MISWLPSAHVAERTAHHYLPIVYGMTITTCPDPRRIGEFLPAVRPTWFFAVPRVWEKLKAGLEAKLAGNEQAPAADRGGQGRESRPSRPASRTPEPRCRTSCSGRSAQAIGLDEAKLVNVGAAPTPREVLVFFHALGVPLAEIWGMSETCGAGASNPVERIKIGTVGLPSPGVELKLAEDGELLVRSPVVMHGYRNLPSGQAIDDDGWLPPGDVATIDEDGYVTIVDRKKELIISAAGKNMSPANIEAALKGSSPLIGQACVVGDGRPYNVALLVLDPDFAPTVEDHEGAVAAAVEAANATLSRPEQIKRWTLLSDDWLPGGEELTPTMKLKRRPIMEKFATEIESMYSADARRLCGT